VSESASSSTDTEARISALQKKKEELVSAKTSSSSASVSSETEKNIRALQEKKDMLLKKLHSDGTSIVELSTRVRTEKELTDQVNLGIDTCFLVDCTGSMSGTINAVKTKVYEIIKQVNSIESKAYMRFAFVGYRDHCDGADRVEHADFVHDIPGSVFEQTVNGCAAKGGGDAPEDIVGGLEVATTLTWRSSTRLLIHFADAPCHGNNYHDPALGDSHPGGDPRGLTPESMLQTLMKKRVDYYFMKINNTTDIMTRIFQAEYTNARRSFIISAVDAAASDFVPKVVSSISTSMARTFAK